MSLTTDIYNAVRELHKLIDGEQERYLEVGKREHDWVQTCRPGCSACCHMIVTVTLVEAIAIVVQLRRQGLLERYEAMLNKPGSPLGRALAAANEDGMNTREWLRRRVRCPLLNMSEECFVYKARPVVCRLYVTNGPSENCWEPGARIPSLDRRDSCDAAWAAFDATSKEAGIPLLAAPLPVTLEWALWVELRGISYLKTKLAGTIHASQVASMLHWGRLENPSGRTWEMTEDFGFKCGICERVSHNRNDLKNRYCAQCNVYHEDLERTAQIHK